ncbi:MAG: patatin-like phospholipase family protein, partial [Gammaproteobacteria bacterium]|nr:patatin-like phospholipase family protein [Gammaproteobacteria bacterium]
RQIAPLSPAIHMGADRVLVIGVSKRRDIKEEHKKIPQYPSLAQVGSHILNSIFIDSLETDLERLRRVNKTIELIPSHHAVENNVSLRPIDVLVVSPSEDLQEISYKYVQCLPLTVRFFLRGIGAMDNKSSSLVSFLLFEKEYCRELINLGYKDAMLRKDELQEFLNIDKATAASCKCE